jgi:hypothetical protein
MLAPRTSPRASPELPGLPIRFGVRQYGEARQIAAIAIVDAIGVGEHPPREASLGFALNLDVDQHPGIGAIQTPDLQQLVGIAPTQLGILYDLCQFLVQWHEAPRPVHLAGRLRKEEGHEVREVAV